MAATERITMTMRELDRFKVMLKPGRAAERLQLTRRQIERLVLRYRQSGAAGIASQARGRPGNRKLDEGVACHALRLKAGLWIPRKQRPPKLHQPRTRRACLGELVQIDGSDHQWFEERAPACTLPVYVDDATSRIMAPHFTATESTFSYFE